ncbi:hypothetical protein HELRODRAFT_74895 [Helobdella robusta]|uniref:long-chain-fatty-acid--CoA ligase n=1 Tax=Helobdella robusta TaxID=6412 RepID=T1G1X4_HELRO|nr:hypothetical protein HELRODRAFT_74895 [Helobdella robusta]ESO08666.1 hypothetical protein HELRODRAFT_74895 [Helobdella robusta]
MLALLVNVLSITLEVLSYLFDAILFIPYYFFDNHAEIMTKTKQAKAKPLVENDSSSPYRSLEVYDGLLTTPVPDCRTITDLFDYAVKKFADVETLGTRELLYEEEEKQPNGKFFSKAIYGDYKWLTYKRVQTLVEDFGCGLVQLDPSSTVCIFADTCAGWLISAFACFKYNVPLTTLYPTLGEDAIKHGLNETEASILITTADGINKFKNVVKDLPSLKYIIFIDDFFLNHNKKPALTSFEGSQVQVLPWSRVMDNALIKSRRPKPDDLAIIMYTSGSTGQPKGVLISHRNICCSMAAFIHALGNLNPLDTIVAYLPLAHMLELSAEMSSFFAGVHIGYSSPNTLNDQSSKIKKGNRGDVSVLQPTLIAIVPVIMDRMYKAVWDKVNQGNEFQKLFFKFIYNYKRKWYRAGYQTPLIDRLVFKKLKSSVGDKLRLMVSGGAPISDTTQEFMNICFCCPVLQGYGLTETCGVGSIQPLYERTAGRVGRPLLSCEIKLVEWPEGGYSPMDKPNPRGEIWISGAMISMGYYKNPEKTAESFKVIDGQRWFATGDIGLFESDGCLRIIDRKKDLVKLQAGEYVSLGKVETVLNLSPYVDNICLCADPLKNHTVALILPYRKNLIQLASELGLILNGGDIRKIFDDERIVEAVFKNLKEVAAQGKLEKFETPTRIKLVKELWTTDAGFVTEAFKLKRKFIESYYKDDIRKLYA